MEGRRWGQVLRLVGPLVLVAVAVAYAGGLRPAGEQPPAPEVVADAANRPCAVLELQEMALVVGAGVLKDAAPDRRGADGVCHYLGLPGSGTDFVEVGIAAADDLQALQAQTPESALDSAVVQAGDAAERVEGLGDAAWWLPIGSGELWTRSGEALLRVAVVRTGPVGDREAAVSVMRALLTKLRAGALADPRVGGPTG